MCPCEPENAAPLGAVNPNLSPFQNRAPPFGSRKYQMPIVSRKPERGIGKGRNIEGITFTGRAGTLCPKMKGQSAKEVLPRSFYAPPRSPWALEPRNFPRTIITFNCEVHSALGMKPEPPFKTADEKFRLFCEHDAEVTACQALLDTTALPPVPQENPTSTNKRWVLCASMFVCA